MCYSCHPAQCPMQLFYTQETQCSTSAQLGPQQDSEELRACTPPTSHRQLRVTETKAVRRCARVRPGSLRPVRPPGPSSGHGARAGTLPEPGGRPHRERRGSSRPSPRLRRRGVTGGGEGKGRGGAGHRPLTPPHTPRPGGGPPYRGESRSGASGRCPGGHPDKGCGCPGGRPAAEAGTGSARGRPRGGAARRSEAPDAAGGQRQQRRGTSSRSETFAGLSRPARRRRAEPPPR